MDPAGRACVALISAAPASCLLVRSRVLLYRSSFVLQTVFIVLSNFSVRAHADNSAPPLISYILSEFKYGEVPEAGCRVINFGCESCAWWCVVNESEQHP